MENRVLHTSHDYALSFQRGEESGFVWFFREFYPALTLFAYKIIKDKPTAEEIASQAFVKTWHKHDQFENPSGIRAYLYQIVKNDCLKWLAKHKKESTVLHDIGYLWQADNQQDHFQFMVAAELSRQLFASLDFLPPQCGRIFRLLYVEGKTVKETAKELKLSVSTVRTQQKRGLNSIRQKLGLTSLALALLLGQL